MEFAVKIQLEKVSIDLDDGFVLNRTQSLPGARMIKLYDRISMA